MNIQKKVTNCDSKELNRLKNSNNDKKNLSTGKTKTNIKILNWAFKEPF